MTLSEAQTLKQSEPVCLKKKASALTIENVMTLAEQKHNSVVKGNKNIGTLKLDEEAEYWRNYYHTLKAPLEKSRFAAHVYESLCKGKESEVTLLDLGCGNGRDTYFFASLGVKSIGLDLSSIPEERGCKFILGDMAAASAESISKADVVSIS